MPRIEIELTSSRADGSWTWRAAGARQPKGTLDGKLLTAGAKVGDVVRADVEVDVDGMAVTAVLPPKSKKADEGRLEYIGPPVKEATTGLNWADFDGTDRQRRSGSGGRDRPGAGGGRRDRPGGQGRPGDGRPGGGRPGDGRPGGARPGAGRPEGRPSSAGGPGSGGPGSGGPARGRTEGGRTEDGRPGGGRPAGGRPAGGRPASAGARGERSGPPRDREHRGAPPPTPKPRPKRLNAGRAHRDEVLASLPAEEQLIAEHLLRGGIPAVRHAVEEQNAAARAAGSPEVKADALMGIAERLMPRLRAAEWRDRAEAAVTQAEELALRDLRTLVASSDAVGRDEVSRELVDRLRHVLDERSAKERDTWLGEITEAMEAGRVVRALRASGRPPEPGVRFPTPLAERLGAAASEAMAADVAPDRWGAVLEAVCASPVRRLVRPQGLPAEAPPELVTAARQAAERVPGLVPLVGAPPPSGRRAGGPARGKASGPAPPGGRPPGPPRRAPIPPPPTGVIGGSRPAPKRAAEAQPTAPEAHAAGAAHVAPPEAHETPGEPAENVLAAEPVAAQRPPAAEPGAAEPALTAEPAPAEPAEAAAPITEPEPDRASDDHGDDAVLVEELS
ncbi:MAG: hypothetical protein ABR540_03365 [Acidimicrobiales bacterium]